MARSITFIIEGDVDTLVTITEEPDGTLRFDIEVLGSALLGDLRALFFDLQGLTADDTLSVSSATGFEGDVTDQSFDEGSVDTLGRGANIKGSVSKKYGDFDVGIEFGTSGIAGDDIQSTSFILSSSTIDLSLNMLDLSDFGIRYTSVGVAGAKRNNSVKIGDQSNGVADNDALGVDENTVDSVDLLANDTNGATNTVTAVVDADGSFTPVAGGFEREVVVDGRVLGILSVTAAGIAKFDANGANVDELGHDAIAQFMFSYTTTAPDGSLATADVDLSVFGVNDTPVAEDVSASIGEDDVSVTGSFVASDIDFGDLLCFQILDAPTDAFGNQYGSVVNNDDGTFTFMPGDQFQFLDEGETRDVAFTYVAIDDSGTANDTSAPQTATVTVTGAYDAPIELTDQLLFKSDDQSIFDTGPALVVDLGDLLGPDSYIEMFEWDETFNTTIFNSFKLSGDTLKGILGGITAVAEFIEDAGCEIGSWFGADCDSDVDLPSSITIPSVSVSGSTKGDFGLKPFFYLTSGDVDSSIPVDVVFTTPRQVEAGETFEITSAFSIDGGASFETNSPGVKFGVNFFFDVFAKGKLSIGNTGYEIFKLDFDKTIELYNISSAEDLEKEFDLPNGSKLTVMFPEIATTGSLDLENPDTLTSSGADELAVLNIDIDALVSLNDNVPAFHVEVTEGKTIEILGKELNLISFEAVFDIVAVNLISTLSVIQDFTLDIKDLPLVVTFEDGSFLDELFLGDTLTVTAPTAFDADVDGDADGLIDFNITVDMKAVLSDLTKLGFSVELFTGLLSATAGITSDFFDDGPSFSLFGGDDDDDDFLVSNTFTLLDIDAFATLFDATFDLEGFNQDTFVGEFDVA